MIAILFFSPMQWIGVQYVISFCPICISVLGSSPPLRVMLSILNRCDAWGNDCQREPHQLRWEAPPVFGGKKCVLGFDYFSIIFNLILRGVWWCPCTFHRKKNINYLLIHSLICKYFLKYWYLCGTDCNTCLHSLFISHGGHLSSRDIHTEKWETD